MKRLSDFNTYRVTYYFLVLGCLRIGYDNKVMSSARDLITREMK